MFFPYLQPKAVAGGPKQPDFSGFTPAEAKDLVDLFTGDFKYNIPLFDLEGFPVNLSYSGNPTMDQEASSVGLGWTINIGSIATIGGGDIKKTLQNVDGNTGKSYTNISKLDNNVAISYANWLVYVGYINVYFTSANNLNIIAQGNIGAN